MIVTPFDVADDLWTYLQTQSAYTDLGLTEYRGLDGNIFPFDEVEDRIVTAAFDEFPVVYLREFFVEKVESTSKPGRDVFDLNLPLSVMYCDDDLLSPQTSAKCFTALYTFVSVLGNREAQKTRRQWGNGHIDEVRYEVGDIVPVPDRTGGRRVVYWRGQIDIILRWRLELPSFAS